MEADVGVGARFTHRVPISATKLNCESDKVATSTTQCVPGATLPNLLLDTRTAADPTADELAMAQDSGLLGGNELNTPGNYSGDKGAGDKPVSPPRTYNTISGNGVVRRLGDSAIPVTAVDSSTGNPLDNYIRNMVRSELAAEGVPMNEPFKNLLGNVGGLFKRQKSF